MIGQLKGGLVMGYGADQFKQEMEDKRRQEQLDNDLV